MGAYALSKRKEDEHQSHTGYNAPDADSYTASTDNNLNIHSVKHLGKNHLLYSNNSETWFFDKATQKVVVAAESFAHDGFIQTSKYAYLSKNCYSKSLQTLIDDKEGVLYIDFSAAVCAGLGITGAKAEIGFGFGFDSYGNIAIYGNVGALASFLEKKVSTYNSGDQLWTTILGAAVGVGASINYCPYLRTVKDLFGLSYSVEVGVGPISIRVVYDNLEHFTGIGLGVGKSWSIVGFSYTDSRNKGLIINKSELSKLFSPTNTKVILGYGYFDYEVDKDGYLNLLMPDFRFITDIQMVEKENDKDFLISKTANLNYKRNK